jgi:ABC-type transport system involved in cytochrome c biogenesis permease component
MICAGIILQQNCSPIRKHVVYLEVVYFLLVIVILFGFATGPSSEEQREPNLSGSNGTKI